ncbi:MAG TPA: biopolymer transporter ExbD [Spirochaetota bacterium]|nr:biopolymer transporter ExbD [Spirochaetota bacterium]HPI91070.1 biopolymer transporter ExbD [Spirochaetota bacterium]HPR49855.1 biopolymer transporter ExbD [Spirochaetota bacterium]
MDFIRKKISPPHIEIAPLVDIIFLLLIFFMLSSNFIKPAIKMDLPKALLEEKLTKVDLVITVSKDSEIYINKDRIELDCLKNALIEKMASLGKYDVIFRGDKAIGYEIFVSILDIAKDAGAVSFSVEHDDE